MTDLVDRILLMRIRNALLRNRPVEARTLLARATSPLVRASGEALLADWRQRFHRPSPGAARATYNSGRDTPTIAESEARYAAALALDESRAETEPEDQAGSGA